MDSERFMLVFLRSLGLGSGEGHIPTFWLLLQLWATSNGFLATLGHSGLFSFGYLAFQDFQDLSVSILNVALLSIIFSEPQ